MRRIVPWARALSFGALSLGAGGCAAFREEPLEAVAQDGLRVVRGRQGSPGCALSVDSPPGEVYGAERLREVLRAHTGGTVSEQGRAVLDALETFGRHAEPHDDVTMLAARRV